MKTSIKLASYQLANKKWVPQYIKFTQNGDELNEQPHSWDKEFDSKEEADKYALGYCIKKGYIKKTKE